MKKRFILLSNMVFVGFLKSQSPITLGNTNMPGNGDTLRFTNAAINSVGNYTQTGVNFNWNFNTLVSTTEGVRSYKLGALTPYAFFFLLPSEYGEKIADTLLATPIAITKYWDFYKKQTTPVNAFVADGAGMTLTGAPVPSYYSDKDELYVFPMTYPQYDSTTFKFSTPTVSIIPISYKKAGYRVTRVDGWGKVITPYDTANCLRVVTTQYAIDTIKTTIGPVTIPIGFPNYVRSYQWLTTTSKIPFMEVTGNLVGNNFAITSVRYRGYKRSSTAGSVGIKEQNSPESIVIYPNPVKDVLYFTSNQSTPFDYEIADLTGALVKAGRADALTTQSINVGSLKSGVYFFQKTGDVNSNALKFIKE